MEAIRIQTTVGKNGTFAIPQLVEGEFVEIIVLRQEKPRVEREFGWAKGKIHILPGFDDPIPGMEEYM